jgi:uncharacterized protein YdeI (YjbR/CyaY-like superfamily)
VPVEVVDALGAGKRPAALAGDDAARSAFERLPYRHRQRHVLTIERAKAAETRQRGVQKALTVLREGGR